MEKRDYNLGYFVKKFIKIPKERWITGALHRYSSKDGSIGAHCALGHCNRGLQGHSDLESDTLTELFGGKTKTGHLDYTVVTFRNDIYGKFDPDYKDPRQSIICELLKMYRDELR